MQKINLLPDKNICIMMLISVNNDKRNIIFFYPNYIKRDSIFNNSPKYYLFKY